MDGSLSPRSPPVVTEASAFGRDFVAPDFGDSALAVTAFRSQCVSRNPAYRIPTEYRHFADDFSGRPALRCIVTQWIGLATEMS